MGSMLPRLFATALLAAAPSAAIAPRTPGSTTPRTSRTPSRTRRPYSPYAGRNYPTRPFFGDTHLHTAFSIDAGAFGARLGPPDAFRFARGEEVTSNTGQPVKLSRPLDFLVVADHSDGFGFFPLIVGGAPAIMADPQGKKWHDMIASGQGADAAMDIIRNFGAGTISKAIFPVPGTTPYRSAWQQAVKAAEEANDPGRFTAFIGYEWTSNTGGNNLHRNVVFRDDATKALQIEPYTTMKPLAATTPSTCGSGWPPSRRRPAAACWPSPTTATSATAGCSRSWRPSAARSTGRTPRSGRSGSGCTRRRRRRAPENRTPSSRPNDEFADFELWDKGNLDGSVAKTKEMLQFEYARSALKNGLLLEQKLGVNPYKFGLIGSSDAHTGLAAMEEDNFFGKTAPAGAEPGAPDQDVLRRPEDRRQDHGLGGRRLRLRRGLGDREHARGALRRDGAARDVRHDRHAHDRALLRRLGVRGEGRPRPHAGAGRLREGRADGRRPARRPRRARPRRSSSAALKDPIGANLDRIQIVKGWLDAKGELHEQVYDVAWSGDRKPDPKTGKVPSVGSTVDVANATWTNTIGAPELIAVWKDPGFDPAQRAFYYARVIEIPTPRWTAYDVKRFGNSRCPAPG